MTSKITFNQIINDLKTNVEEIQAEKEPLSSKQAEEKIKILISNIVNLNIADTPQIKSVKALINYLEQLKSNPQLLNIFNESIQQTTSGDHHLAHLIEDSIKHLTTLQGNLSSYLDPLQIKPREKTDKWSETNNLSQEDARYHTNTFEQNVLEYGNKAANLILLQKLLSQLKFDSAIKFSIPAFLPIGHHEVLDHLSKHAPHFENLWEEFQEVQAGQNQLTERGKEILALIRSDIKRIFSEQPFDSERINSFREQYPSSSLFMTRSSGRQEDTEESSNAGGNESVAAVSNDRSSLSEAIGQVIASYFSEKSLNQRLLTKDDITAFPFVPVLMQVMVGEQEVQPTDLVSVAGVIFTQEAEGPTEGVTAIQSTFGNNEGIVNGKVPFDTFYIHDTGHIHPIIAKKTERLVPLKDENGKRSLEVEPNPRNLQNKSTLSDPVLQALKKAAQEIKAFYGGKETDIEFVYDRNTHTVYIVQARPIIHSKQTQPSYVNLKILPDNVASFDTYSIVAAGGQVKTIFSPEEAIITESLSKALEDLYLPLSPPEKQAIKAVFVKEKSPSTSHEATIFRGEQKLVLVAGQEIEQLEALTKQGKVLLADPQQGKVLGVTPEHLDTIDIEQGWKRHPISSQQSLTAPPFSEDEWEKAIQSISEQEMDEEIKKSSLSKQLDLICAGSPQEANQAIFAIMQKLIKLSLIYNQSDVTAAPRIGRLVQELFTLSLELQALTQRSATPLERLYLANFVEAIIKQTETPSILQTDSLYAILSDHKIFESASSTILELSKERQAYLKVFLKFGGLAFNKKTRESWTNFVTFLAGERSIEEIQLLSQFLSTLQSFDISATWLNIYFGDENVRELVEDEPSELLEILSKEKEKLEDFLKQESIYKNQIKKWEELLKQKETAKLLNALVHELPQEINSVIQQQIEVLDNLDLPLLAKIMATKLIKEAVELFDGSIKMVKSSPLSSSEEKVSNFVHMLQSYKEMMSSLIDQIPDGKISQWWPTINDPQIAFIKYNKFFKTHYKRLLNEMEEGILTPAHLYSSQDYSVAAAKIDSGAKLERIAPPQTWEDLFTLMHQNSLVAISCFNDKWGLNPSQLPKPMRALVQGIMQVSAKYGSYQDMVPHLVGIDDDGFTLTANLNFTLNFHSAYIQAQYNKKTAQMALDFQIFGEEINGRMEAISEYTRLMELALSEKLSSIYSPLYNKKKKVFQWKVNIESKHLDKKLLTPLKDFMSAAASSTFDINYLLTKPAFQLIQDILPFERTDDWMKTIHDLKDHSSTFLIALGTWFSSTHNSQLLTETIKAIQEAKLSTSAGTISNWDIIFFPAFVYRLIDSGYFEQATTILQPILDQAIKTNQKYGFDPQHLEAYMTYLVNHDKKTDAIQFYRYVDWIAPINTTIKNRIESLLFS